MIYLLRHGLIEGHGEKRFVGQLNPPLSELGRQQAQQWRGIFKTVQLDAIYCSDLQRSCSTARIVAGGRQAIICMVPELREIHLGAWEGVPMASVRRDFPDQWRERGLNMASYKPPGGESFNDLEKRVLPAYAKVVRKVKHHGLIVSHAGVNRIILSNLLGMPIAKIFRLEQDHGGLTIISYQNTTPRILAMNMLPENLPNGLKKWNS